MMSPAFIEDRYSVYDEIRNRGRLQWVGQGWASRWVVTGHRQVQDILQRHDRFSSDRHLWEGWEDLGQEEAGNLMITMDPPEHTRVRGPAQQALTPRGVQRFRPRVEELVDEMLTAAAERGEIDLMSDFADPLPLRVLAEILGVPAEAEEFFRHYTMMALAELDVVSHTFRSQSEEVKQARAGVEQFFSDLIAERRERPRQDLISAMVQSEEAGDRLTSVELRELCIGLMGAGLEPATYMIGNAVNAMFEHPDQAALLRADPDGLMGTALDEFLRYDAPVHLGGRIVREDVEVDGQEMRKGQLVAWFIGAANRDPEAFPDPNRLDLSRKPNHHLTFGYGIHRCVGSPVARMVLSVAIPALATRFPAMRPAGDAHRHTNPHVHAFESLPVALA
jgi:cytochrome P450